MRRPSPTARIFLGLVAGVIAGALVFRFAPARAGLFEPFATIFLRLIKMIVGPLIFSTLVAGVAGAGGGQRLGRVGAFAIVYFELVTTAALFVGLVAVNLAKPGVGVTLPDAVVELRDKPQRWDQILVHVVPESVVQALAQNDVLQLVVFALLFAVALRSIGEKGRPVVAFFSAASEAMFVVTDYVMLYAPIGVAAAIGFAVGKSGLGMALQLGRLVATLYGALFVFVAAVLLPIALAFGVPLRRFGRAVREPALIAFTTASSEAALPRAMETMEGLGVPRPLVAFVLPLGYSFNLDGSTLYLSLASVFVAQAAGVHLTVAQQASMLLTLMLTSKGVAGVSRASLVVLAATVSSFGLPSSGIKVILAVDVLMDMGRTAVNVIGNCLATAIAARWQRIKLDT